MTGPQYLDNNKRDVRTITRTRMQGSSELGKRPRILHGHGQRKIK